MKLLYKLEFHPYLFVRKSEQNSLRLGKSANRRGADCLNMTNSQQSGITAIPSVSQEVDAVTEKIVFVVSAEVVG